MRHAGSAPIALVIVLAVIAGLFYFFWQIFGQGPVGDAVCNSLKFCETVGLR